jgi:hypothetical protein
MAEEDISIYTQDENNAREEDQRRRKEGERNAERKKKKRGVGKERTKIPRMAIT